MTIKEFKNIIHSHILGLLGKEGLKSFFKQKPLIIANSFVIRLQEQYLKRYADDALQRDFHFLFKDNADISLTTPHDAKKLSDFGISDAKSYLAEYQAKITDFFETKIAGKSSFRELRRVLLGENTASAGTTIYKDKLRLLEIQIKNYQAIKQTELSDLPADTRWIFLTGENGFGKTAVLRAIALGLCGFERYNYEIRRGMSIKTKVAADDQEREIILINDIEEALRLPQVVGYGASRLDHENEENTDDTLSPLVNLFKTRTYLKNIEHQLSRWVEKEEEKQRYRCTIETLKKALGGNISNIRIDTKSNAVYYKERYTQDGEAEMTFEQLATGYKSLINMVGDLILRLFAQQPKVENPEDLVGIVLIDEFDLHLHPKLQRVLPRLLSECFPKVQFIVSTHSPIPLLGAPKDAVFLKVTRNKEEGITLHRLDDVKVRNLTPNTILTSPLFDFENIISDSIDSLDDLETADDYNEVLERQTRRKRIEEAGEDNLFNQLFAE